MSVSRESIEKGRQAVIQEGRTNHDGQDPSGLQRCCCRKTGSQSISAALSIGDQRARSESNIDGAQGRQPLSDTDAIGQGVSVGGYPSRPLSAAPNQLSILDILQRQALEGRIDPADIKRTIRTEKEIDRRLAAEAIIRELGLEAKAEPIIAELIQGPKATSTGQRLAAMQPAMNNIRPAQILALLAATGLGGGVTAALLNQGNQQQQQQPVMAAQ